MLAKLSVKRAWIAGLLHWPSFNSTDLAYIDFNVPSTIETGIGARVCPFWDTVQIDYST